MARGDWTGARSIFDRLVAETHSAPAYEGQSWAAWWQDDAETALGARERAYQLYREADDLLGAARMAIWLANDYFDFLGETAVTNGWVQVAQRLLDERPTAAEHGLLAVLQAEIALLLDEDTVTARQYAQRATAIGRQVRDKDVEVLGRTVEGLALVNEGMIDQGMSLLDEAASEAVSGSLQDRASVSFVLCHLLYACENSRDYDRASQWCHRTRDFADRIGFRFAQGTCRVHYASVLLWRGMWAEAERELADSSRYLLQSRPPWESDARVRLAELRRRQGRLSEAEALFREVEWHPLASLGLAELQLAAGLFEDAEDYVQRVLRTVPERTLTSRAAALDIRLRILAATGRLEDAREAMREFENIARTIGTLPMRCAMRFLAGEVAAAAGEDDSARAHYEDAIALFERCGAPYEAARARLGLATVLQRQGRSERARRETMAGAEVLRGLGALSELSRAEGMLSRQSPGVERAGVLTERQVEVLRLVAQGLSDREIAAALVMSEHTVHRHIANILQRLNLPTRAAAVAEASRLGLI